MALTGTHVVGEAGHVEDHNLIVASLNAKADLSNGKVPSSQLPDGLVVQEGLTFAVGADAPAAPAPGETTVWFDPNVEALAKGAQLTEWIVEAHYEGTLSVVNGIFAPGILSPKTTTLTEVTCRVGTAPAGSGLTVRVNKDGVSATTVTIAAGATSATVTGLSVALVKGSVLSFDITAVGSTTPGVNLAVTAYCP